MRGISSRAIVPSFLNLDKQHLNLEQIGKRLFIKDIMHYGLPPNGKPASIAPSLSSPKKGVGTNRIHNNKIAPPYPYDTAPEPNNPTVLPLSILRQFHFTFLIRHPRYSIPSYFRCTVPPLDAVTGFHNFMPSEAGYDELRRTFDYLRSEGLIGPSIAGRNTSNSNHNNGQGGLQICVVDADDLLDQPAAMTEAYCASVGIKYDPSMLVWDTDAHRQQAQNAFAKWKGFHEDAIESTCLRPRVHAKVPKSEEAENEEWTKKYGVEAAKIIRDTVNKNVPHYEYLKQFALKV